MRAFFASLSLVLLLAGLGLVAVLEVAGRDLPSPSHLQDITPAEKTRVLDKDGKLIGEFYRENRILVTLDQIPKPLVQAFLAVEDRNFYKHWGIHVPSIFRAVLRNAMSLRVREGASTITQQLARNLFLTHEQTLSRKIKEAVLAVRIEQNYSKEEILEMYLNQIYFGEGAYGVQSAARGIFGKDVRDLTLPECALLAGLPRNPRGYSPFRHADAARRRRDVVLVAMRECGYVTREQADAAKRSPVEVAASPLSVENAPYFMEQVRQMLEKELGSEILFEGGLTIHTTLDLALQQETERILENELSRLEKETGTKVTREKYLEAKDEGKNPKAEYLQGAAIVMDAATGAIRTLVGGRSFDDSNFNRATSALRQPGSAFKPFIYLTAIEKGYYPSYMMLDAPVVYEERGTEPWRPQNYDREFRGPVTLRVALEKSINIPTIKLQEEIGTPAVIETAREVGLKSAIPEFRSIALGTAEVTLIDLVYAYGVFAQNGIRTEPYFVTKVEDPSGNVLREYRPKQREVLPSAPVALLNNMLQSVVDHGTGAGSRSAGFTLPAAGKTGTTDDYSDAWFVGYTPRTVGGVWVGYDKPRKIGAGMSGTRAALPIWTEVMKLATRDDGAIPFEMPDGVVARQVCSDTGLPVAPACPNPVTEHFLAAHVPTETCYLHGSGMRSRFEHWPTATDWGQQKEEERHLDEKLGDLPAPADSIPD
jgi:penicillin-binding protein 1A